MNAKVRWHGDLSFAGCTAMDVVSILQKKRQKVTAFEVEVSAERAEEHPRVLTSAVILYEITGRGIKEASVRRAIALSAQSYCPAQAMLSRVMPLQLHYRIFEGSSADGREPRIEGRWTPDDAAGPT